MKDLLDEADKLALSELHDILDCVQSDLSVNIQDMESIHPRGTLGENLKEVMFEYVRLRKDVAVTSIKLKPGWVCKDKDKIAWVAIKPEFSESVGVWICFNRGVVLDQAICDPWPDHAYGGAECLMEVNQ